MKNGVEDERRSLRSAEMGEMTIVSHKGWLYRVRRSRISTLAVVSLALLTDMLVYGLIVPILPDIIKNMGRQPADLGFLVGCYALGLLILTPIFGYVSDRWKARRLPMLVGLLGLAGSTLFFAFATRFEELVIARVLQGVSGGASWTIGLTMLADAYPKEQLGSAMGVAMGANVLGQLLGPPLGGILYQFLGPKSPFIFAAILAFIDFLGRLWVIPPVDDVDQNIQSPLNNMTRQVPLREMILDPGMVIVWLCTIIIATVYSGLEPTLPLFLASTFSADQTTIGLLFTAIVVPNIVMAVLAGRWSDRYGGFRVATVGLILMALSTPLVARTSLHSAPHLGDYGTDALRSNDCYCHHTSITTHGFIRH